MSFHVTRAKQTGGGGVIAACGHCREASRKASLMMDSSILDESREPLKLPAFEKAAMQSVTRALEVWRDEAMESGSPTPAHIMYVRH